MKLPDEPKKGYPIVEWCRSLVRYLRAERIVSVVGGRMQESPNGKTLVIDKPKNTKRGAGGAKPFMWDVARTGVTEDEPPLPKFKVKGGIAVVQGTKVEVADVAELAATATSGFICLKVLRVSATRIYDALTPAEIVWRDTEPTSDYVEEYIVLAEYSESTGIKQCRNDEIYSYELMLVINGEFKLLPIQANSRNSYDPPT